MVQTPMYFFKGWKLTFLQAESNPDVCEYCGHNDLEDLCVCTSVSCTPNTARCVSWCCECEARFPCEPSITNHISCWDRHLPRGWRRGGGAAHLQRPAKDQVRINEIFHCETDPQKQKALHQRDKEARWFIIDPSTQEDISGRGILYVTNRFEYLTQGNIRSRSHSKQFPSLVSFIGETGAGKSTLIRALIKLYSGQTQEEALEIPVTRIRNAENLTNPTSSGVHLYKDPATFASTTPILFADCEGFNAGAAISSSHCGWDYTDDEHVMQKIRITSSLYNSSSPHHGRSGGVEDLYSRFLYAFSDVVCLVSTNAQTITQDIEKLLIWASRGLQTSLNQTQKKTLILVLNAPIEHESNWMDEHKVCDYIFKDMADVWKNSPFLDGIRNKTNKKEMAREKQIRSTKDFMQKYFQKIRVCYVPLRKNVHSNEVQTQCDLLRTQITQSSKDTAEAHARAWTQYNIQDLSRLFSQAFEHFATEHNPFDFYRAARQDNPNPLTMTDHIMNLLRHIEMTEDLELTESFPKIVASGILNNALRGGQAIVDPRELWQQEYARKCADGISRFYRQHATCQFRQGNMRCICKYSVHDRVHRDKDGSDIGIGHFEPQDIAYNTSNKKDQIEEQFYEQYSNICEQECQLTLHKPSARDIVAHRKAMLESLPIQWDKIYSYKTCFSCLCAVPDHVFPCGHAQCEDCVSDFGECSQTKEAEIILRACVFCSQSWDQEPQQIQTRPPCAGIRVLTLDGGGIRGILELEILKKIEDRIGLDIGIQNFFDLVVGTSTGGIIALGLVVEDLRSEVMIEKFKEISTHAFKHTRGPKINLVQMLSQTIPTKTILLLTKLWESVYPTTPLREGLQAILGKKSSMFGSAIRNKVQRSVRVAVMTVKDRGRQAAAIANYNRPVLEDNDDFERAENEGEEIKAWEAGLCTAAAPIYFRPFKKVLEATKTPYLDGGLLNNNPIFWASSECGKIWGNTSSQDILVSVGTGYFPNHRRELPVIRSHYSTAALLNSYFENIDGERTWEKFKRERSYDPRIHHRINVQFESKYCRLDQYQRMEELANGFLDSYMQQAQTPLKDISDYSGDRLHEKIEHISQLLTAKLFFFQPTGKATIDYKGRLPLHRLQGKILCRLRRDSHALKVLVERIDKFSAVEAEVMVEHSLAPSLTIGDPYKFKTAVRAGRRFEIDHVVATTEPSKMLQMICVKMKPDSESPAVSEMTISGFPCKFNDLLLAIKGGSVQR